jgi:hypothetical protein
VLGAITAVLCYLALTRQTTVDPGVAEDETSPTAAATDPGAQPPAGQDVKAPKVPDQRRKDFTQGDDTLPDGATTYDSRSSSSGLVLSPQGLTHGPVKDGETDGIGLVETELKTDVRSLGFRVRFPEGASGSAVLAAWKTSAVAALDRGGDAMPTGLRLLVSSGGWTLSVLDTDGEQTVAEGSFDPSAAPVEVQLVREGADLYVVDPAGLVTMVTDASVPDLVGPFASWALYEPDPGLTPAVIESVWAG